MKIRIEVIEHAFLNFTIQRMPLYQNKQMKYIQLNEYAHLCDKDCYKDINIYQVQPLNQEKGIVYIKDFLTSDLELEVINNTQIKGNITISNLNLQALTVIGFKRIHVEKSSIQMIQHNDKQKVKVDTFSQIGQIK